METTKDFIINTIDWKLIHNTNSYPDSIRTDFMFESSILLGKIAESVIDSKPNHYVYWHTRLLSLVVATYSEVTKQDATRTLELIKCECEDSRRKHHLMWLAILNKDLCEASSTVKIESWAKVLLTVGATSLQMLEEFVQGAGYFCLQGDLVEFQRICRTMRGYTP